MNKIGKFSITLATTLILTFLILLALGFVLVMVNHFDESNSSKSTNGVSTSTSY